MSPALALAAGATASAVAAVWLIGWRGAPVATNHRGARVPIVLGLALAFGAVAGGTAATLAGTELGTIGVRVCLASLLVFAAGLVDDLLPSDARGLRGHLRAAASGQVTTGIVKLLVVVAASIVVVAVLPRRGILVSAASVITAACSANVLNALDLAPGRALKVFLLAGVGVLLAGVDQAEAPVLPALVGAGAGVLAFDLRERGMLGDGGSNLLGFALGVGLVLVLPEWAVIAAGVSVVALNLVAETVTFSAVIDRWRPLRWFDRVGRPSTD